MKLLAARLATLASLFSVNVATAQEALAPVGFSLGEEHAALRAAFDFSAGGDGVVTNASFTYVSRLDDLTLFIGASLLAESLTLANPQASFAAGLRLDGLRLQASASDQAASFDLVLVAP